MLHEVDRGARMETCDWQMLPRMREESDLDETAKRLAEIVDAIGVTPLLAAIERGALRVLRYATPGKSEGLRRAPEAPRRLR